MTATTTRPIAIATGAAAPERDARVRMLNAFLATPHRRFAEFGAVHADALARDPLFYAHLALWYFEKGEVRDHRVLFAAHLLTGEHAELRDVGWVLLQRLAPYEVARVLDHAKQALGKSPRALKSAIAHYLRVREANPQQFDSAVLRARKAIKHLYSSLRLKPGPRAQAILFDERPPAGSTLAALKLLAKTESADEQARMLLEHRIPYTTALGALKAVTPPVLVALIAAMTPQEVINSLAALKRRGAFGNADVKALIDEKLRAAGGDARVSTLKAKRALAATRIDDESERTLTEATDRRVQDKAQITLPTALFVDKSSSMTEAVEVAKQIAALVGAVAAAGFHVYAFDTVAFEIAPPVPAASAAGARPQLSDWERAFRLIKADGGTSIGAPLAKMKRDKVYAEQIVVVTDEGENSAPFLRTALADYQEEMGILPRVTIVHVGAPNPAFAPGLEQAGAEVTRFEFTGDYYSLPNVLPLLALPSRAELVDQIMARELPRRPGAAGGGGAQEAFTGRRTPPAGNGA